jgi:SAM-dependent methyltransferase
MTNTESYIQRLLASNPLREPLLRTVMRALKLPAGSHGLDAGCGIGLQTILMLETIGADGTVTGVDIDPGLLAFGKDRVEQAGLSSQITLHEGDVNFLPFEDDRFDWVWSVDCIGYPAGNLTPILYELIRVVKPGGSIILLGWSSQQLLPGYPLLEARLNGICSGYLPFLKEKSPESNFMRALGPLRMAGLDHIEARSFVGEVHAPLSSGERTALVSLFEMLWGEPRPEVAPEDWKEFQRYCEPTSPDFILDLKDYYAFFTYTMFRGEVSVL